MEPIVVDRAANHLGDILDPKLLNLRRPATKANIVIFLDE